MNLTSLFDIVVFGKPCNRTTSSKQILVILDALEVLEQQMKGVILLKRSTTPMFCQLTSLALPYDFGDISLEIGPMESILNKGNGLVPAKVTSGSTSVEFPNENIL